MKIKLQPHPISQIFPMMSQEQYEKLKQDIADNGVQSFGLLYEGKILDGRNRYKACCELGIELDWQEVELGEDIDKFDPVAYVLTHNLHRRHLTTAQRSMIAAKLATLKPGRPIKEETPQFCGDTKCDEAAKLLNVSPRSVESAKHVIANGSKELVQAVERGDVSVSAASRLSDLSKPQQNEVLQQAKQEKQPLKKAVAKAAKHVVPRPDSDWTESEIERRRIVEQGGTVVANQSKDKCLIRWASDEGLLAQITRGTRWGNPFILDEDGTRDEVCDAYGRYLNDKPSLERRAGDLRGKVLVCWCYPERCHGDELVKRFKLNDAPK